LISLKFLNHIDEIVIKLENTKILWFNKKGEEFKLKSDSNIFEQLFFDDIEKFAKYVYEQKSYNSEQIIRFPSEDLIYGQIIYISEEQLMIIKDKTKEKLIEEIKYNLVSSIAHEILTPLSSLKANSLILKEKFPDTESLDSILNSIKRIERIVKQTQLIAMAQMGLYELKKTLIDPKKIFEEVKNDLSKIILEKNIKLELNCHVEFLEADGFVIYTILRNLLSNAVKYSFENSVVEILITDKVIQVKDHGIGIKKEDLNKIFQRFYRSPEAIKMTPKGSGLGLSVVKHLAQLAGYSIKVESDWMLGTTFKINLR